MPGYLYYLPWLVIVFVVEWFHREKPHGLEIAYLPKVYRGAIYFVLSLLVMVFGYFGEMEFVYFQF
jgi:hypothetical protein